MNEHINIKEMISAYIDGGLNEEQRQVVEDRLITDQDARQYYVELTKLSSVLGNWDDEDVSFDLNQKLHKKLEEVKMKTQPQKKRSWHQVGAGSAIVAIVAVVIVNQLYTQSMEVLDYDKSKTIAQTKRENILDEKKLPVDRVDKIEKKKDLIESQIAFKGGKQQNKFAAPQPRTKASADDIFAQSGAGLAENVARKSVASSLSKAIPEKEAAVQYEAYSSIDLPEGDVSEVQYREENVSLDHATGYAVGALSYNRAAEPEEQYFADRRTRWSGEDARKIWLDEGADYDGRVMDCQYGRCEPMPIPIEQPTSSTNEQYDYIQENEFLEVAHNPLSTFSIDVDTTSYTNIRRFLQSGQMPPKDAVRIEEMVNYFSYNYPNPKGRDPFSITTKISKAPWNPNHQLALIGLQGKTLKANEIPPSNIVFLIDVSGSMNDHNKLPLLKNAFEMMVNQLSGNERVAIVTYAGSAGLVLDSTPGSNKYAILSALDRLQAGGSTAGGQGIQLAYDVARRNFIKGGNNRVILATDGDFNVGVSNDNELTRLIERERDAGVFLTVLGFGTGNLKDAKMEKIANNGNGTYHYIDSDNEAQKVLINELGSTLFTIAKDVKLQIEFNPAKVKGYRLIGYENRALANEDFNNDAKDAGELGAGHTVTALYEIIPASSWEDPASVDKLKYQTKRIVRSNDIMTVKLRYKHPDGFKSKLISQTVKDRDVMRRPSGDFQFAAAVAEFGLILRDSQFRGSANYQHVIDAARQSRGNDEHGYRQEFIDLVRTAQQIDHRHFIPEPEPLPVLFHDHDHTQGSNILFKGE